MKKGLLLINLGSPDQPTSSAVRRYLRQFLMDRHVIDIPWSLRFLLVQGVIAPTRAPKSAKAYQSIWSEEGSPLVATTKKFTEGVKRELPETVVEMGMRYGRPTVRSALERLRAKGVDSLEVVPLYPQYANSSTLTAMEEVSKDLRKMEWKIEPRYLQDFYDHPKWIENLASRIEAENEDFKADFLLMSYHGLPEHHLTGLPKNRNYKEQCYATSEALRSQLQWPRDRLMVSFQSRLGRRPWIQPFTDLVAVDLANKGVKRLLVTCPSFVADCLETLEEISIRLKEDFLAAGGEELRLVPAVNDSPKWIGGFVEMLNDKKLNWLNASEVQSFL